MFTKSFANYLILLSSVFLSANIFAAYNDTSGGPLNPASAYDTLTNSPVQPVDSTSGSISTTSTSSTTTSNSNKTMNMNAASDGSNPNSNSSDAGIFTVASGQKCIPSCEGTYVINGQNYPALLFLKDARSAFLISPYNSKDSLNYKQLTIQKNLIKGTWRPKDDGTIEFRSTGSVTIAKSKPRSWGSSNSSSRSSRYSNSNSDSDGNYYDNY